MTTLTTKQCDVCLAKTDDRNDYGTWAKLEEITGQVLEICNSCCARLMAPVMERAQARS